MVRWLANGREPSAPTWFLEHTASLSLVAIAVVAFATWRAGFRPKAGWWILTIGFAALALGPFVLVGGVNTYVPGPWALLRYVPVIGLARMPTRFAIVAALGLALLLAGALVAIGTRWPARRKAISMVVGALIFELWPAPSTLYSAEISLIFDIVAADPRPVWILNCRSASAMVSCRRAISARDRSLPTVATWQASDRRRTCRESLTGVWRRCGPTTRRWAG